MMPTRKPIALDFEVDKLTHSIENVVTGDSFPTEVSLVVKEDWARIKKEKTWLFDWEKESKAPYRQVYKLTIVGNPDVIQGLVCIEIKVDHVYMHLLENAEFNVGKRKMYFGVSGNLVAFACKVAFEKGFEGNVAFVAKTQLIQHYEKTLGAFHFGNHLMILPTPAAQRLVYKYFNI